jgi:hemoglobin
MLDPESSLNTRQSLYTRLWGYDTLAAFVRELMPKLHYDPELGIYWKGKSLDSRRREDKFLVDFLSAAFEGPVEYFGRDMKISHDGLGVTEREWDKTIGHIAATLDTLGVAEREKTEVMQAACGLKWDIVAAPAASA